MTLPKQHLIVRSLCHRKCTQFATQKSNYRTHISHMRRIVMSSGSSMCSALYIPFKLVFAWMGGRVGIVWGRGEGFAGGGG